MLTVHLETSDNPQGTLWSFLDDVNDVLSLHRYNILLQAVEQ